ncbi:MAG TPA: ABC transporter ATP-binding protein, partial [Thermoanaerobaculia bacterium]
IDEVILELKERLDVTIVTITHHMESARKIGDRVALIHGGRLLYQASPEEFLRSDDPAVRQFVEGRAEGPLTVEFDRKSESARLEGA